MKNKRALSKSSQVKLLAKEALGYSYYFSSYKIETLNYPNGSTKLEFKATIFTSNDAAIHAEGTSFKGLLADLKAKVAAYKA